MARPRNRVDTGFLSILCEFHWLPVRDPLRVPFINPLRLQKHVPAALLGWKRTVPCLGTGAGSECLFCPLGISETAFLFSWQDGSQGVKGTGVGCHGTVEPVSWDGRTRSLVTCQKAPFCLSRSENQGSVGSKSIPFTMA